MHSEEATSLFIEKYQLEEKIARLNAIVEDNSLSSADVRRIVTQLAHMNGYASTLAERYQAIVNSPAPLDTAPLDTAHKTPHMAAYAERLKESSTLNNALADKVDGRVGCHNVISLLDAHHDFIINRLDEKMDTIDILYHLAMRGVIVSKNTLYRWKVRHWKKSVK